MQKLNLRKGDLVIAPQRALVAVLLKQTRKFWYYYLNGQECRIEKGKLWNRLDSKPALVVKFGSTMKRRKTQPKWRTLDLHGVRHADVEEKLRRFLNWVEMPTRIITGNSVHMKSMVEKIVLEYGWFCRESVDGPGQLIVEEKQL